MIHAKDECLQYYENISLQRSYNVSMILFVNKVKIKLEWNDFA